VSNGLRQSARGVSGVSRRSGRLHWPFEDPASFVETAEERLVAFSSVADRIHGRVMVLSEMKSTADRDAASLASLFIVMDFGSWKATRIGGIMKTIVSAIATLSACTGVGPVSRALRSTSSFVAREAM